MTVVITVPQQTYTPQTLTFTPTVPGGIKEIRVTLTRVTWPSGPIGTVSVVYPGALCNLGLGHNDIGVSTPITTRLVLVGASLPSGQYTITVVVAQTVITAIVIETF